MTAPDMAIRSIPTTGAVDRVTADIFPASHHRSINGLLI